MIFAIERGGCELYTCGANRGRPTCQFIRTRSEPPMYPDTPFSDPCSLDSSPMKVPSENDTGSPLQFHKCCFPTFRFRCDAGCTSASNLLERRCRGPAPTWRTARMEVRNDSTDNTWRMESDMISHMVDTVEAVRRCCCCVNGPVLRSRARWVSAEAAGESVDSTTLEGGRNVGEIGRAHV